MRYLRTNTATRVTVGPFFDKTDGVTPEVALTVTSEKLTFMVDTAGVPTIILDVAPTASGGANDMVHVTGDDAGFYDLELAAADVNYLGRAMLALTDAATHCPVFHEFMIVPAMIYDAMFLGTDTLQADVTQLLGTAWLTPAVAGTPDVNSKQVGGTAQTGGDIPAMITAVDDLVDTEVAAIKAKTDLIPAAPAAVGDIPTAVAIRAEIDTNSVDLNSILTNIAAVQADTDDIQTRIPAALVGGRMDSNIDAALDAAGTELSAIPTTTGTLRQKINYIFQYFRNKRTVTATTETMFKEDAATSLGTGTLSDDGTTATKGEVN